jgi:SAM-dependent methyltransferase
MTQQPLTYTPTDAEDLITARLSDLLQFAPIVDSDLLRRIDRIEQRFRGYASTVQTIWTPGIVISHELRSTAELYLPFRELRSALLRLLRLTCHTDVSPPYLLTATHTWPDFAARLPFHLQETNPTRLLRRLMGDGDYRTAFIFALYQPRHYGGAFGRYPGQYEFLRSWLAQHHDRFNDGITCLDAACGSGEGTWELLQLLVDSGLPAETITVTGTTHEPIELFSAAHGFFPHDPQRTASFRHQIASLRDHSHCLRFQQEDITAETQDIAHYDIILCNGILGGPFLHEHESVFAVVKGLAERLRPSGILLAADHFHGGWKQIMPDEVIRNIFFESELNNVDVVEGAGGQKS